MRYFKTSLLAILLSGAAVPAFADCMQFPADPLQYFCDVPGTDGLSDDTDNLDIGVGEIDVLGKAGLRVRGADVSVEVFGIIRSDQNGIEGGNGLGVDVQGDIDAGDIGVEADDKDGVSIDVFGSIQAVNTGVQVGDGAEIDAEGLIASDTDVAIEAGDDARVRLLDGNAEIRGGEDGIQVGENADIDIVEGARVNGNGNGSGVKIKSGSIFNEGDISSNGAGAAAIHVEAGAADTSIDIGFSGSVSGDIGVLVDKGETGNPANTRTQNVQVFGSLVGRNGIAADLGAGEDWVRVADANAFVDGLIDLGGDNDALVIGNLSLFDIVADGGADFDTATFEAVDFVQDVMDLTFDGMTFTFTVDQTTVGGLFSLSNFEMFEFGNTSFSSLELRSLSNDLSAVPLPSALLLLGGALLGLGIMRR